MDVEYRERHAHRSSEVIASIVILLVLVAGLFTYKSSSALTRLRQVQSTGALPMNARVLFSPGEPAGADVVGRSVRYLIIIGPALLFGVLIGGAVRAFVAPSWLTRAFGRGGIREHVVAGVSGAPLMLCSCCVAPVFSAIYERSSRLGPALAVALAAPSLNPAALVLTFMLFRPPMALARLLMALAAVFIAPALVARISGAKFAPSVEIRDVPCENDRRGIAMRLLLACAHVAVRTVPIIVVGVVLSIWLAHRIPMTALGSHKIGSAALVAFASLVALPVALPTFFEIPLAFTLMGMGAPAGVALVVLFAGPATNLPSLLTIGRTTDWKVASLVGLSVAVVACIGGLLVS